MTKVSNIPLPSLVFVIVIEIDMKVKQSSHLENLLTAPVFFFRISKKCQLNILESKTVSISQIERRKRKQRRYFDKTSLI